MKGLVQAAKEPMEEEDRLDDLDIRIAFGLMASTLLEEEGQEGIIEAVNQTNPVIPLATMIASVLGEVAKGLQGTEYDVDPNVWLEEGGAVDQVIDMIDEMAGPLGDDVKAAILSDVTDQIKLMAQEEQGAQQMPPQGMAPQMAPPMPMQQGGVM
jgi:hypothetical protein